MSTNPNSSDSKYLDRLTFRPELRKTWLNYFVSNFRVVILLMILVTAWGRLCLHRNRINITFVLAGQKLGVKEVDDGIWLVSFMHYDLGYFDLEQKTLQPLDNPFGTRLSPMSKDKVLRRSVELAGA